MSYFNNSFTPNMEEEIEYKEHPIGPSRRSQFAMRPNDHSRPPGHLYSTTFPSSPPYTGSTSNLPTNSSSQSRTYHYSNSMGPLDAGIPINVSAVFSPQELSLLSSGPSPSYASPQTSMYWSDTFSPTMIDGKSLPTPLTATSMHSGHFFNPAHPQNTGKSPHGYSYYSTPGRDNFRQGFGQAYVSNEDSSSDVRPQTAPSNRALDYQGSIHAHNATAGSSASNSFPVQFPIQASDARASTAAAPHFLRPPPGPGPIRTSSSRKQRGYSPYGSKSRSRSGSEGSVHEDGSEGEVIKCKCGREFGTTPKSLTKSARSNLKRHIDEQSNKQRFRCFYPGCTYAGARQENLASHQEKRQHK